MGVHAAYIRKKDRSIKWVLHMQRWSACMACLESRQLKDLEEAERLHLYMGCPEARQPTVKKFVQSDFFQRLTLGKIRINKSFDHIDKTPFSDQELDYKNLLHLSIMPDSSSWRTVTACRLINQLSHSYINNTDWNALETPDDVAKAFMVLAFASSIHTVHCDSNVTFYPLTVEDALQFAERQNESPEDIWFDDFADRIDYQSTWEQLARIFKRSSEEMDDVSWQTDPILTHGYTKDEHFFDNIDEYSGHQILTVGSGLTDKPGPDETVFSFPGTLSLSVIEFNKYL